MVKVDGEMIETGEYKYDAAGVNKAVENIGKYLKMFTDKIEFPDKDGNPQGVILIPPKSKD